MKTIDEIINLINAGKKKEASKAVEHLLSLGETNIEALKIKANLLSQEGKFRQASNTWEKILKIDPDNLDAFYYFENQFIEEKEKFYFTDELPNGGRRFLLHPQDMINSLVLGVFGCIVFLFSSNNNVLQYFFGSNVFSMTSFFLLVMIPWIFIICSFFMSPYEICLTDQGVFISSKVRKHFLAWHEISQVQITHLMDEDNYGLFVVFLPKDKSKQAFEVDISSESTAIRSRGTFVEEIIKFSGTPTYSERKPLVETKTKTLSV